MTSKFCSGKEGGMRKLVAYLLLLCGVPTLMLAEDIGWPRETYPEWGAYCLLSTAG